MFILPYGLSMLHFTVLVSTIGVGLYCGALGYSVTETFSSTLDGIVGLMRFW